MHRIQMVRPGVYRTVGGWSPVRRWRRAAMKYLVSPVTLAAIGLLMAVALTW